MQEKLSLRLIQKRRRVVIHHTHLLPNTWPSLLTQNDIVFFDDCLFSQWIFLKKNCKFFADKSIDCILGFSSGLYASEDTTQQIHDVESSVLHNVCNAKIQTLDDADRVRDTLPEMSGFMKISQLKELLELPFCHLALHGCCHLKLENEPSILKKLCKFKRDLDDGIKQLKSHHLQTSMYVYPYVYSFAVSDKVLSNLGFQTIIGGNQRICRVSIEDLHKIPF